ncbi:MAG: STAS domain-containing protein [Deltaproteobacteria bacterium]|nr:STAS domain-containing protein [Deltaproteobacteria bacterium]
MNVKIEAQGNVSVVQCSGSLDADSVVAFKKVTLDLINSGATKLVIDCAKLTFVDSMGLGAMISLLRRVRSREGDLKVSGLTDDVKTIFEITRLHRLFEVFPDAATACRQFEKSV